MKKLTALEEDVLLGMGIVPNMWQEDKKPLPSEEAVYQWCVEHGLLRPSSSGKKEGRKILEGIYKKIAAPDNGDSISLEDEATWILSKRFTLEQLEAMLPSEIISWLQDWKYFYGFRKIGESDALLYQANAIAAIEGRIKPQEEDEDVIYVDSY